MGKQYVLKVYVPGQARSVFRTLQISGRESLDGLADAILKTFCFHDDYYMYEFFMDCRPFSENCYRRYRENEDASSAGIRLDDLDLKMVRIFFFTFLLRETGGLRSMYRRQRRKKSAAVLSF